MRIEELIIDEEELNFTGVFAFGLVTYPAHEKDFKYYSADKKKYVYAKISEDNDKHMIYGPAIIPNKHIIRYDENGNEYVEFLSAETIEKLSRNFMKNHNQTSFTFQHEEYIDGALLVEQWIIEDGKNDKAHSLGFTDLPKGTWMMGVHVTNNDLWKLIKEDVVKGFSLEAWLMSKVVENSISKEQKTLNEITKLIENHNKV